MRVKSDFNGWAGNFQANVNIFFFLNFDKKNNDKYKLLGKTRKKNMKAASVLLL